MNSAALDTKSPGFVEKLVAKIVDNIQIEIKSVFINYFDEVSSFCKFSFGLAFDSLVAVTCNSNWEEEYVEGTSVMYKLVSANGLRVYLDYTNISQSDPREIAAQEFEMNVSHNFILPRTYLRLEVVMNKKPNDFSMPQLRIDFTSTILEIKIDTIQVKQIMKAVNFINLFEKFKEEVFSAEESQKYRELYIKNKTPGKNNSKAEQTIQELENYEKEKT